MGPKKNSLASGNPPGEFFFCHLPARILECVSEFIFSVFQKNTNTNKNQNKLKKKRIKQNKPKKKRTKKMLLL